MKHDRSALLEQLHPFDIEADSDGSGDLRVSGEVDLSNSDQLRLAVEQNPAAPPDLRIDLSTCDFLDSSGIAVIANARRLLEKDEPCSFPQGAHGQPLRILSLTGLESDRAITP